MLRILKLIKKVMKDLVWTEDLIWKVQRSKYFIMDNIVFIMIKTLNHVNINTLLTSLYKKDTYTVLM